MYLKEYCLANWVNSLEEYYGPLSVTTSCGILYLANMDYKCVMLVLDVSCVNLATSMYREK